MTHQISNSYQNMKPIIFFSHSSLDRDLIVPIKNHILHETGNTIQIFMSSDGASIPFGKNWLKEIEDALGGCQLMFSWVTPNSIKSNWIYFESGYAYSRGIKVAPLGFDGINLEDLAAPLSFLQGFNIKSAAGLNNIIAVINNEFDLTFPNVFDDSFYEKIIQSQLSENSSELLQYIREIECKFHPTVSLKETKINLKENWLKILQDLLNELNQNFTVRDNGEILGIGFKVYPNNDSGKAYPSLKIDPLAINSQLSFLREAYKKVYDKTGSGVVLNIKLKRPYKLPDDNHLISSRLSNSEVEYDTDLPHFLYRFRNILFRISSLKERASKLTKENEVIVIVDPESNEDIPILSLIKLLAKRKVISEA